MTLAKSKNSERIWKNFAEQVVAKAAILDEDLEQRIVTAFSQVARSEFVEPRFTARSASDISLPIGFSQAGLTPSLVARLLALLNIQPGHKVLHIGCGSGYVSALCTLLGAQVFALESIGLLAQQARKCLDRGGFQKVLIKPGDGEQGWPEYAPFDHILITTVFENIDFGLFRQLKVPHGRLLAFLGTDKEQSLCLWEASISGLKCFQLETGQLV